MEQDRVQDLVERLSHVLREDLREAATRHGLALAQLEVLRFLARCNRFSDTVTSMVDYLGATKGTLSQSVNALERKGFVVRVADPDDRRVQHCRLTAAGLEVVRTSHDASILRSVGGEREATERLERLLSEMLAARGGRAFGVCASCAHHRRTDEGRRCDLLGVDLSEEDASRICREHAA